MHELSITESILAIALRHAEQAGATRIAGINVVMGKFSSVVDDSVQFYWDMIAAGTIAEGARLYFQRVPAQMTCRDCGHTFEPDDQTFTCPQCFSPRVKITQGEELWVESIDIE